MNRVAETSVRGWSKTDAGGEKVVKPQKITRLKH